jgi:hypothetical protein
MAKSSRLTPRMLERMKKGPNMPGWVKIDDSDWMEGIAGIGA